MELQVKKCLKLRAHLKKSLKSKFPGYIAAIVEWVRMRKSRAELDMQVFGLLEESVRRAHFDFLVSLSKLCWGLSSLRIEMPIAPLTSSLPPNQGSEFQRLGAPQEFQTQDEGLLFRKTYAELSLPGVELIRARLYLAAWDAGLTNVDSKVSRLLHTALRHYVKDIIQAASAAEAAPTTHRAKPDQALSVWWAIMQTNCDRPSIQYCPAFTQDIRDPVKTL